MAKTVHRLDEEEKKIIDLIRQHKLDYYDVTYLLQLGADGYIKAFDHSESPILKRIVDKYTKLLNHLEGE